MPPPLLRLAALAALAVSAAPASAQHAGHPPGVSGETTAFVVDGLRVDPAAPPPGSAVGRAGLRFGDGGYVSVVYGKPFARGRVVFGGLVGYGQVWSAGAHRATELWTSIPLMVGGVRLEPGGYSLFATPGTDRWTLHLNRRLGMHLADEYDPAEDVVTVEVAPETLAAPLEALTYTFETDGRLGLRMAWERTAVTLPLDRAD